MIEADRCPTAWVVAVGTVPFKMIGRSDRKVASQTGIRSTDELAIYVAGCTV
jgi:hypothetical protein